MSEPSTMFPTLIGGEPVATMSWQGVQNPWLSPQKFSKPTMTDAEMSAELVGMAGVASAEAVEAALEVGAEAEAIGRQLSPYQRRAVLERLRDLVAAQADFFARLIVAEAGKPIDLARVEVQRSLATISAAIATVGQDATALDLGLAPQGVGRTGLIRRVPRGLVTAVTPFNFPLNLVLHKLAPAIAAGCPVILKPSPQAPLCAFHVANLALEAGLPGPMLSVIMPEVEDMAPLISDERVKVLSFTGSADVGWHLKAQAVRQHVILELGGNAAVIICKDAPLDRAIPAIATGAFAYAGQSCISVQRVFVDYDRGEEFTDGLVRYVQDRIGVGDPSQPGVLCGPMISGAAATRIESWLDEYAADRMEHPISLRGQRVGNLVPPAIVEFGLVSNHRIVNEEAFGPVLALSYYTGLPQAIECVNNSRFGLQAGIFTDHLPSLQLAFRDLEVGALIHNDVPAFRADHMPYGGIKDSGVGWEGPAWAVRELTEQRMLVMREEG